MKVVTILLPEWLWWCFGQWVPAAGGYWVAVNGSRSFPLLPVSPFELAVHGPLLHELLREVPALPFSLGLVPFATVQPSLSPPWCNKLTKKSTYANRNYVVLSCYSEI